jgi:hypothetical protein
VVCLEYRDHYGQIYTLCRLSPELYLRRPPALFPEWRLDRLLLKKAKEGVKVYVIVYKEVSQTMSMGSHHTKVGLNLCREVTRNLTSRDKVGSRGPSPKYSLHGEQWLSSHKLDLTFCSAILTTWDPRIVLNSGLITKRWDESSPTFT